MIIETLSDGHGLELIDPLDKSRFVLRTPKPVSPTEVDADGLDFPVERAVEVQTSSIEMHANRGVVIRDLDGTIRFDSSNNQCGEILPRDSYVVELSGKPMKIYLSLSGPISFERKGSDSELSFGQERSIIIGVRSKVRKPPGTITVTDDTNDIMRAMSLFGSVLKTTSSERSYPTLRGHPPLIERGNEFHVSSSVTSGETETTLVLPPEREYLYPATSLAYYLNSSVVSGRSPRLIAKDFEYELGTGNSYEETIERILRQVFFLDCLVRTDGFYSVELYEREVIEPRLDIDLDVLFDTSLEERLRAYLGIPFDTFEPVISSWHLAVDMVPTVENVEILPFLANKLAFVRTAQPPSERKEETPELVHEFYREGFSKNSAKASTKSNPSAKIFEMEGKSNTRQRAWVGPGYPLRWSKLTYDGLHSYSTRSRTNEGSSTATINVTIVCNDPMMQDESNVVDDYELWDLPQFNVTVHHRTTKAELMEQLSTQTDFFHYIGHISDKGIHCEDGYLDVQNLSEVNVRMFLLNACNSYEQGMALLKRGSTAGIVTLSKVSNATATEIGRLLVRLLSSGFQFQTALSLIHRIHLLGYRYIVLGDAYSTLCQTPGMTSYVTHISSSDGGMFEVKLEIYPAGDYQRGIIVGTAVENTPRHYLPTGEVATFDLSKGELEDFFMEENAPVEINGDIYWSDELTAEKVRELL
ncbi:MULTISPECIES: hypothetical protein [unclassified Haladaptatus]|uniref:hypothetical protein n=1 Tax=unclassified Haladaptatus TaxID=2622732 RepID=UPI0007B4EC8C|nr:MULTISPECIES: hypothetical protein [unclassified Haladaptatus]KZN25126.1 hypothetical protein A4G99_00920 [Haladaptatus sp. R4]MCO8242589.1 hypothetical protein [Haladaptatus sp. AB643]MCO8252347.1 hypothetical protein [Haladaptatus sp. AB618]